MTTGTFGDALKAAMGETQMKRLVSQTGIPSATLYAYRKGTRNPSRDNIDRIADALGLDDKTRQALYGAAGLTLDTDLAVLAARLVKGLPTKKDKELAVELLRTQARMSKPTSRKPPQTAEEIVEETAGLAAALDHEGDAG